MDMRVIQHAESNERVAESMRDLEGICLVSDGIARAGAVAIVVGLTALLCLAATLLARAVSLL
jgi:hypothetical protein